MCAPCFARLVEPERELTTLAARDTFLIDPSGVIRKVYLKVNPQGHSDEVLADLQQLQAK